MLQQGDFVKREQIRGKQTDESAGLLLQNVESAEGFRLSVGLSQASGYAVQEDDPLGTLCGTKEAPVEPYGLFIVFLA